MKLNLTSRIRFLKQISGVFVSLILIFFSINTHSQELDVKLIQLDLGRDFGVLSKSPSVLRAVSVNPLNDQPKTALLFFVGWPGQLWLPEKIDPQIFVARAKKTGFYALEKLDFFPSKNINFVLVDCPTDQWGSTQRSTDPTGCSDSYRSSEQHGKDIAVLINYLKEKQGIEKIYIMGHSYGSVSSRWLAINLGDQIQGSIHSASMSRTAYGRFYDYASSVPKIEMNKAKAPWIFLHNRDDQCQYSLYSAAKASAGAKLISVRGGIPGGDPCLAGHYHSYQGRELEALGAVAKWIQTGELTEFVGEP